MLLPPSFQTDGDGHQGDASLVPAPQMVLLLPLLKEQVYKIASCELGRTTCQNKPRQCRSNPKMLQKCPGVQLTKPKEWAVLLRTGLVSTYLVSWLPTLGQAPWGSLPKKLVLFVNPYIHPIWDSKPHQFHRFWNLTVNLAKIFDKNML